MKYFYAMFLIVLYGCGSTPIQYDANISLTAKDAAATIERSLLTQPSKYLPEYVDITGDYLVYGLGTVTRGRNSLLVVPVGNGIAVGGGHSKSSSKTVSERIYFDALKEIRLYSKRRLFVVVVVFNDRQPQKHFYLYNEDQAKKLADALRSMNRLWTESHGQKSS